MKVPALAATMERRLLVNYRVGPDMLAPVVPPPFRPAIVGGYGIAGICLIRLGQIRPAGLPAVTGLRSENAAHRIAVTWDGPDGPATGVYVPRRDTSSRLAAAAGGRVFPGWQHRARFDAREHDGRFRIQADSRDGRVHILVAGRVTGTLPPGSVFADLDAASRFFRCAPVGYSATPEPGLFDGIELHTAGWDLQPLHIEELASSYFDDPARFPAGSAIPDSAFLMAGLTTIWRRQPPVRAAANIVDDAARLY